mmetsp:Transcript_23058/g.58467  ORF Transcript_23058/g.58467 Transcript_23058/m.58467 type:complete len:289 (-) Transcript_23058:388-1254(-)
MYGSDIDVVELTPELLKVAREELNEVPENRAKAMEELRGMMREEEKKGELKFHRYDDSYILRFLRNKKFEVGRAFQTVLKWATFRKEHPELYNHERYSMEGVADIYRKGFMLAMEDEDMNGRSVMLMDLKKVDFHTMDFIDFIRTSMYLLEIMLEDPRLQVKGAVYIEDIGGVSFKNLMFMFKTMNKHKKMMKTISKDALPMRIAGIYVMNQPFYLSVMLKFGKAFLKKKMKERIHVYGKHWDKLHDRLMPKESLPPSFGGTKMVDPEAFIEYAKGVEAKLLAKGIEI